MNLPPYSHDHMRVYVAAESSGGRSSPWFEAGKAREAEAQTKASDMLKNQHEKELGNLRSKLSVRVPCPSMSQHLVLQCLI
jgi:hypothetical protein